MIKVDKNLFWVKVDVTANEDLCWNWVASKNKLGYGKIGCKGKSYLSNRMAYYLYYNVNPDALCVLHKCDNPSCCNPKHLFLGTKKDNSDDMISKGRKASFKGEKNSSSKITEEDVFEIIKLYEQGWTVSMLANKYNLTWVSINNICKGKNWCHVTKIERRTKLVLKGRRFFVYKDGNIVGEFTNHLECAQKFKTRRENVTRYLSGSRKPPEGYVYKYLNII